MSATGDELIEAVSRFGFADTMQRVTGAIEAAGLTIFARIDHAAGAQAVGLAMRPTVVLLYGNAKGGTPIMQAFPATALDLPLRVLVREDEGGRTLVALHLAAPMLARAGVPASLANRLEPAQHLVLDVVTNVPETATPT